MTTTIDLSGEGWRLRGALPSAWDQEDLEHVPAGGGTGWFPASVPGSVQHDLWSAGLLEDPYVGRNTLAAEWAAQRTWVYERTFAARQEWRGASLRLRFDGVDYRARFLLNGTLLGEHESMSTPAVFDVTDALRFDDENRLTVVLAPAPDEQDQLGRTSLVRTRKTRMGYWWDFAPRLVNLGLWDSVSLEVSRGARIDDVAVHPRLAADRGSCAVTVVTTVTAVTAGEYRAVVDLVRDDGVVASGDGRMRLETGQSAAAEVELTVADPELWWPNGLGAPALHRAVVRLLGDGDPAPVDERGTDFGIRSIELVPNETPDPTAPPYTFVVNGRRTYINGWNWVPVDSLYGSARPGKLTHLLELAARAHCNLLRVNGVGVIEREEFYAHCDRLGIMVWQEFVVTSSATDRKPREDAEYVDAVVAEATAIVPRRRNHPSLVLWCAGNELESLDKLPLDDSEPVIGALREVTRRLDPDTVWLPTSARGRKPFNGLSSIRRDPDGLHDVHGPWLYEGLSEQYELYNAGTSLFHSELGGEAITNPETLRAVLPAEERTLDRLGSPTWQHLSAWWVRPEMWATWFGEVVADLDRLIGLTQWLQAEGVRYGVESNRRRAYRNSGSLPWQFNEPYPMVGSTAAVDYYGRPKPLYYAVAAAYRPLAMSARYDTVAWGSRDEFVAEAWVANALSTPLEGAVVVARVLGPTGAPVRETRLPVDVRADGPTRAGRIACPLAELGAGIFFLDLAVEDGAGVTRAAQRLCFSATPDLAPLAELPDTELVVTMSPAAVTITNEGERPAVGIRIEDVEDVRLPPALQVEDAFFSLLPGESRTVGLTWNDGARGRRLAVSALNAPATVTEGLSG